MSRPPAELGDRPSRARPGRSRGGCDRRPAELEVPGELAMPRDLARPSGMSPATLPSSAAPGDFWRWESPATPRQRSPIPPRAMRQPTWPSPAPLGSRARVCVRAHARAPAIGSFARPPPPRPPSGDSDPELDDGEQGVAPGRDRTSVGCERRGPGDVVDDTQDRLAAPKLIKNQTFFFKPGVSRASASLKHTGPRWTAQRTSQAS